MTNEGKETFISSSGRSMANPTARRKHPTAISEWLEFQVQKRLRVAKAVEPPERWFPAGGCALGKASPENRVAGSPRRRSPRDTHGDAHGSAICDNAQLEPAPQSL